jgi:anti-anti-sigma factor
VHPAQPGPAASYSCHRRTDGNVVCRVRGEVDTESGAGVHGAFQLALDLAPRLATIVVDLSGMGFCDSTGLNAMLRLRHDAHAKQVEVVLSEPGRQFMRLLEVTGTDTLWTVHPSLRAAIR